MQKTITPGPRPIPETNFFKIGMQISTEDLMVITLDYDNEKKAMYRLKKRIQSLDDFFSYFITLTFSDKPKSKVIRWRYDKNTYEPINHNFGRASYPGKVMFFNNRPMYFIHDTSFSGLMREFINNIQTELSKYHKPISKRIYGTKWLKYCRYPLLELYMDYLWKYEEGKKNNRPHFHMMFSIDPIESPYFDDGSKSKGSVPVCIGKLFSKYWNYGLIEIAPVQHKYINYYIGKYFTKSGGKLKYFPKNKRRFSTSRSIPGFKKNNDFIMSDENYETYEDALEALVDNEWYVETYPYKYLTYL